MAQNDDALRAYCQQRELDRIVDLSEISRMAFSGRIEKPSAAPEAKQNPQPAPKAF